MTLSRIRKNERGVAVMLITVTVLILTTLILIYSFQNSSMGILIGKNLLDKAGAVKNAQACEQIQVNDIVYSAAFGPLDGTTQTPSVPCTSSVPVSLGQYFPAGYSTSFVFSRYRLTSQGTDNRLSQATLISDVVVVSSLDH